MTIDGMSIYVNNIRFETPIISPTFVSKPYGANFAMNIGFNVHHIKHLFFPHLKHHNISMNQWAGMNNLLAGKWSDLARIWVMEWSFLALGLYASRACPMRRALCMHRAHAKIHWKMMPSAPRALYALHTCKNTKAIDAQCAGRSLRTARPLYAPRALSVHSHGFKTRLSPFDTPIRPWLWKLVKITCLKWLI